jgi:hypothetical protein
VEAGRIAQTETPEFKAWFGKSKVVDKKGAPLRMYHGTQRSFSEFKPTRGPYGMSTGYWFTSNPETASKYAGEPSAGGANVMPVYVGMSRPKVFDVRGLKEDAKDRVMSKYANTSDQKLQEQGYDGVMFLGWDFHRNEIAVKVFDPKRVKSATGNKGTFDPASKVITDSMRADWDESQHPRGQPENAGEFARSPSAGTAHSYEFVSPNIREGTHLKEARLGLKSTRHKFISHVAEEVDKALRMKGEVKPVIGLWSDGAENSTMTEYASPSWDHLVLSASMKGWLAKQKQVLIFREGDSDATHGEEAFLASFHADGSAAEISQFLAEHGLIYHTLEPISGSSSVVHVYGQGHDDTTMQAVKAAGEHYGSKVDVRTGRGAFLGTHKEDGTADEQRADARAVYDREIAGSRVQRAAELWQGLRDRYGKQADEVTSDQTETPQFRHWFGGSKIVDEDGQPAVLYHGTLGNYDAFDKSKASIEGNWGAGFYFTNDPDDLSANYAGYGPDITNRIENLAEQIENEGGEQGDEIWDKIDPKERHAMAKRYAEKQLGVKHEGAAMPVFLKMDRPFKVGGKDQSQLDYDLPYNEETEEYADKATGKGAEFIDALREIAGDYESAEGANDFADSLQQEMMDGGGIPADKLELLASKTEGLAYAEDPDTGKLAASEILRKALQKIGFDGIIDTRVSKKFPAMKGMKPSTAHYIVFEPNQIKSAIGNRGTFDPAKATVTDSVSAADAYNPNEARIPKGQEGAGQWTASGGGGLGFTKGESVGNTDVWNHANGGKLAISNQTGNWRYFDPETSKTIESGQGEESLSNFIYQHREELQPKEKNAKLGEMGFTLDKEAGTQTLQYWDAKNGGALELHGDGSWSFDWADGSGRKDVGPNQKSLDAFLDKNKEALANLPSDKAVAALQALGFEVTQRGGGKVRLKLGFHDITVMPSGAWRWKHEAGDQTRGDNLRQLLTLLADPENDYEFKNKEMTAKAKEMLAALPQPPVKPLNTDIEEDVVAVGGDDWNKATAVKLEKEFKAVLPEIDKIASEAIASGETGGEAEEEPDTEAELEDAEPVPTAWDELSEDQQEKAKQGWMDANEQDYKDSEKQNYYDNGDALGDAKSQLAYNFDQPSKDNKWAEDAVQEFLDEEAEAGTPVPYTAAQIIAALDVKFDNQGGGDGNFEVVWDNDELRDPSDLTYDPKTQAVLPGFERPDASDHLTPDMRENIKDALEKAFDSKADDISGDMEPDDYIYESVSEYMDDAWDNLSEKKKWGAAVEHLDPEVFENKGEVTVDTSGYDTSSVYGKVTLDTPPKRYDPLNVSSGKDYKKTQALSRIISIDRAQQVLQKRGLIKQGGEKTTNATAVRDINAQFNEMAKENIGEQRWSNIAERIRYSHDPDTNIRKFSGVIGRVGDRLANTSMAKGVRHAIGGNMSEDEAKRAARNFAAKLLAASSFEVGSDNFAKVHIDRAELEKIAKPGEWKMADGYGIGQIEDHIHDEIAGYVGDQFEASGERMKERLRSIDNNMWEAWKGSSTSDAGKLIQIASADEFGGRLRLPEKPPLDIKPAEQLTAPQVVDQLQRYHTFIDDFAAAMAEQKAGKGDSKAALKMTEDRAKDMEGSEAYNQIANRLTDTIYNWDRHGVAKMVLAHKILRAAKFTQDDKGIIHVSFDKLRPVTALEAPSLKEPEDPALVTAAFDKAVDASKNELESAARDALLMWVSGKNQQAEEKARRRAMAEWGGYKPTPLADKVEKFNSDRYMQDTMRSNFSRALTEADRKLREVGPEGAKRVEGPAAFLQRGASRLVNVIAANTKMAIKDGEPVATINWDDPALAETLKVDYADSPAVKAAVEAVKPQLPSTAAFAFDKAIKEFEDQKEADAVGKYQNAAQYSWDSKQTMIDEANKTYKDIGGYEGFKAMIRSKWETTQYLLHKAGVKTLKLYRGVTLPETDTPEVKKVDVQGGGDVFQKIPEFKIERNGAASTSTDRSVSNKWHEGQTGKVTMRIEVPRTAALSIPAYGVNVHGEHEVVVVGTAWKNWDAWLGYAPRYVDVPLAHHRAPPAEPEQMKQAA